MSVKDKFRLIFFTVLIAIGVGTVSEIFRYYLIKLIS
jgi:hypothetical protein